MRSSFIFLEDKNVMIVKINYLKGTILYTLLRPMCHSHENAVLREAVAESIVDSQPQLPPIQAHDHMCGVTFPPANLSTVELLVLY